MSTACGRAFRRRTAAVLAVCVNGSLLLGCATLNKVINGPHATQVAKETAATASPTAKGPGLLSEVGHAITGPSATLTGTLSAIGKDTIKPVTDAVDGISPQDERAVGQAASLTIVSEYGGLLFDRELIAYVNDVANIVGLQGERKILKRTQKPRTEARRFFVGILNDPSYNAFALPGGYLYVTKGLLENLSSESDLAWVLGHEIAHVDQEHGLAGLKAQVGGQAAGGVLRKTVFGAPAAANEVDFKSEKFFGWVSEKLVEFLMERGYKKSDEIEADQLGLTAVVKVGYDPHAAERVLGLLAIAASDGPKRKTHKDPMERLALLQPEIDRVKKGKMAAERFEKMVLRLEVAEVIKPLTETGTP